MSASTQTQVVAADVIERMILLVRSQKVMLDSDLAVLYGAETKHVNQAVRRNLSRFPPDFMFQLKPEEAASLRSQFVTSSDLRSQIVTSRSWGGRRYRPKVFTEQGVAMLSSVLNSKRAIQVNISIMRAFVRLRQILATHQDLARKLDQLERKYDGKFKIVFEAIRQLMQPPLKPKRRIGFISGPPAQN